MKDDEEPFTFDPCGFGTRRSLVPVPVVIEIKRLISASVAENCVYTLYPIGDAAHSRPLRMMLRQRITTSQRKQESVTCLRD